jgi:hypothetical protein
MEVTEHATFNGIDRKKVLVSCFCSTFLVIFDRTLDFVLGIKDKIEIWAACEIRVRSASW